MRLGREIGTQSSVRDLEIDGERDTKTLKKEGYLFLRGQNIFTRVWVTVGDGLIRVEPATGNEAGMTQSIPLLLCTVKSNSFNKLRFMFEIVSPGNSLLLQADSDNEKSKWYC